MVGVAVTAGQGGIIQAQHTMQSGSVLPLGCHVGVTDHTSVGHAGGSPKGSVTQVTLASNFCVGVHAAQRRARLCIEPAGAEQHAARCESEPCDDEGGQNGSHNTGGGKKTQAGVFHHSATAARLHNTTLRRYGKKRR